MLPKSPGASPLQWYFLFPVGESSNQPHGHAGVIARGTIAHGYYVPNPVIRNELIDLLVQLRQFLHGLKYLQLSGKSFYLDHSSYLRRPYLMIHFDSTMMVGFHSMNGTQ